MGRFLWPSAIRSAHSPAASAEIPPIRDRPVRRTNTHAHQHADIDPHADANGHGHCDSVVHADGRVDGELIPGAYTVTGIARGPEDTARRTSMPLTSAPAFT